MAELFFLYLRTGFFAGVMIVAILLLRPLLRRAPRNISCVLWLLVALRLLLPFQLESPLSLQPRQFSEPAAVTDLVDAPPVSDYEPVTDLSPVSPGEPIITEEPGIEPETVFAFLWVGGALAVMLYAAVSYGILRYRVRDAVRAPDGTWESDRIGGAFLLGYFRPQIYIPIGLSQQDRSFILAHERAHQSRGDHWWKLLGMLCLSIHWYHPLVWLSYALLCRDIEVACDERVIHSMVLEQRQSYSLALLNSGKRLSGFLTYPVAFGEISLKERIKRVLSYRKPSVRITALTLILTILTAVCFMTNPTSATPEQPEEKNNPTQITEPSTKTSTAPSSAPTEPTVPETQPSTEPPVETVTAPTEATATEPTTAPSAPPTTKPAVLPTEPTPTKPPAAPTEPKPVPTEPPATKPTEPPATEPVKPEPTEPPATVPTEPPVTEPEFTLPAQPEFPPMGGTCGNNAVWEYNEQTRHLTIGGSGPMDTGTKAPWHSFRSGILSVSIADGITSISPYAFSDCSGLRSVSIPGSVVTIGKYAFDDCENLRNVQLSEGLRTLESDAFNDTGIRSIIIPKTVTKFGRCVFSGCDDLNRITFTGAPPKFDQHAFLWTTATAYYPEQTGAWQHATIYYGGDITWELCCANHSYINGVCERCGSKKGA